MVVMVIIMMMIMVVMVYCEIFNIHWVLPMLYSTSLIKSQIIMIMVMHDVLFSCELFYCVLMHGVTDIAPILRALICRVE